MLHSVIGYIVSDILKTGPQTSVIGGTVSEMPNLTYVADKECVYVTLCQSANNFFSNESGDIQGHFE